MLLPFSFCTIFCLSVLSSTYEHNIIKNKNYNLKDFKCKLIRTSNELAFILSIRIRRYRFSLL